MKVFVDGLSRLPSVSVGTQALIIAAMQIIEKYVDDCEFVMLSAYPDVEEPFYCNGPRKVELVQRGGSQLQTIADIRRITGRVDAVASTWGDGYITFPPHKILLKTQFFNRRIPRVMFPASVGPFKGGFKRFLSVKGLGKFDVLMARDTVTYQYFQELGLSNVELVPDTAFVLEPAGRERVAEILEAEGLEAGEKYVGFNVSQLLNTFYKQQGLGDFEKFMAEAVRYVHKLSGLKVVLIPHQVVPASFETHPELGSAAFRDDRTAIRGAMEHLKDEGIACPILGEYTCSESKGIIKGSEVFIGGRMHSVIAAVSSGVPSAIIQYSHKARGVMELLGLGDYLWEYTDDKEKFFKVIDRLMATHEEVRKDLAGRMGKIINDAWKAGEHFVEAVRKYEPARAGLRGSAAGAVTQEQS